MTCKRIVRSKLILFVLAGLVITALLVFLFLKNDDLFQFYHLNQYKDEVLDYIHGFGPFEPLVFIIIQILQVIVAPVPGEASGLIGGLLFGTLKGFIFSTIGLTLGSWINFTIGRYLGYRWVRRLIPETKLARFDRLLNHQGVLIVFLLFLFPGFPKDYLCLFLGMSAIPFKAFLWLSTIGRMPGTLSLSLQGALLLEQKYTSFFILLAITAIIAVLSYYYRNTLYQWVERMQH
jgi:uncharacterized membrane protein YdjX (TVP38/TMEM64 family)